MKQAVAIAYNWDTGKVLYTPFEGDDAALRAHNWVDKDSPSKVWRDFPESEGWAHFVHSNQEARDEYANMLTTAMFGGEMP